VPCCAALRCERKRVARVAKDGATAISATFGNPRRTLMSVRSTGFSSGCSAAPETRDWPYVRARIRLGIENRSLRRPGLINGSSMLGGRRSRGESTPEVPRAA